MRLPEQRFWDRARRALVPALHIERIENVVGEGTPDIWVLAPSGRVTPVELKAVQGWPKRATTRVLGRDGLNRAQRNWHLRWRQAGGVSAVLVGVGGNLQYLFPGHLHDEINELTQQQFLDLNAASDWAGIENVLNYGFEL